MKCEKQSESSGVKGQRMFIQITWVFFSSSLVTENCCIKCWMMGKIWPRRKTTCPNTSVLKTCASAQSTRRHVNRSVRYNNIDLSSDNLVQFIKKVYIDSNTTQHNQECSVSNIGLFMNAFRDEVIKRNVTSSNLMCYWNCCVDDFWTIHIIMLLFAFQFDLQMSKNSTADLNMSHRLFKTLQSHVQSLVHNIINIHELCLRQLMPSEPARLWNTTTHHPGKTLTLWYF